VVAVSLKKKKQKQNKTMREKKKGNTAQESERRKKEEETEFVSSPSFLSFLFKQHSFWDFSLPAFVFGRFVGT